MQATHNPLTPLPVVQNQCILCLEGVDTLVYSGSCACRPTIHAKCLNEWFTKNSATCPICRAEYARVSYETQEEPSGLYCCLCISTVIPLFLYMLFA